MKHCNPVKNIFCPTMDRMMAQEVNSYAKGLVLLRVTDMTELTKNGNLAERTIGVYYKLSTTDSGVMLNYCPWCGSNILKNPAKGRKTTRSGAKNTPKLRPETPMAGRSALRTV